MLLDVASPTGGTLVIIGAVVIGTIVDGVFTQYAGGESITIDSQTTGNLVKWGAAGHIADAEITSTSVSAAVSAVIAADEGWGASQSSGDKSVALQNYTSPGFGGGDTISQGAVEALATQVVALTQKVQALQAAGAAKLRPNA